MRLEKALVWDVLDLRDLREVLQRVQLRAGNTGQEFWRGGENELSFEESFPPRNHIATAHTRLTLLPLPLASPSGLP